MITYSHDEALPRKETLTNTAASVLGMVALGARSGYAIRQAAERSLRFFWALGPPQIYAELKRLEEGGLLTGRDDGRGGRPRRHYEPTDAGRAALRAWFEAGDASPLELRDAELLRLFFADAMPPGAVRARIAIMRGRSRSALDLFDREIDPAAVRTRETGAAFPGYVAEFGRELHGFVLDWCDRLEARLAEDGR